MSSSQGSQGSCFVMERVTKDSSPKRVVGMTQKESSHTGIGMPVITYEWTVSVWVTLKGLRNNCEQKRIIRKGYSFDSLRNRRKEKDERTLSCLLF